MSLRVIASILLAGTAWSATSQEYGPAGQGFAATGWPTPADYADLTPPPYESQNGTHYNGEGLLEEVTDRVSGDLDKQLRRELRSEIQVDSSGPSQVGE